MLWCVQVAFKSKYLLHAMGFEAHSGLLSFTVWYRNWNCSEEVLIFVVENYGKWPVVCYCSIWVNSPQLFWVCSQIYSIEEKKGSRIKPVTYTLLQHQERNFAKSVTSCFKEKLQKSLKCLAMMPVDISCTKRSVLSCPTYCRLK